MSEDISHTHPHSGGPKNFSYDANVENAYRKFLGFGSTYELNYGILQLIGEDCVDFLQRLSTNDFNGFSSGNHLTTILTTEKGRIVDIIKVIHLEEELLLLTTLSRRSEVQSWLQRFIITERVEIVDATHRYDGFCVIGPHAESIIRNLFKVNALQSPECIVRHSTHPLDEIIGIRDARWSIPKYDLLVSREVSDAIAHNVEDLKQQSLSLDTELQDRVINILRVEQRIVSVDMDIDANTNPLEARLETIVSFTKGCYIGQEVVARLDSYKKLQRVLDLYRLAPSAVNLIGRGSIYSMDIKVGWTTSCVWSYHHNAPIALGYVKTGIQSDSLELRSEDSSHKFEIVSSLTPVSFSKTNEK